MTDAAASGRTEIEALTGVRGFAALWVLVFHAQWHGLWETFPSLRAAEGLVGSGWLGVDVFFVLSGFILTHTYAATLRVAEPGAYPRYLFARLGRIYPVHLAVLLFMAAWALAGKLGLPAPFLGHRARLPEFLAHVAMLQAVIGPRSWNVPAWSISAEWAAYLWFPFACGVLARIRGSVLPIAGAAAALAATLAVMHLGLGVGLATHGWPSLVRVTGEFAAGCLLARASASLAGRAVPWTVLELASAAACFASAWFGKGEMVVPFAGALAILALAHSRGPLARLFSTRAGLLGGRLSFAVYMVHAPWFTIVSWATERKLGPGGGAGGAALWVIVYLIVPWGIAALVRAFVEEPCRRGLRRWSEARFGAPGGAS